MADGTNTSTVARNALTCQSGQVGTSSGDYYAPPDRQFAPVRHGNAVKSYTDGRSAMHAMAEAIRGAKKFIFIADWQMNFDTELTGRGEAGHRGRLSELLYDAINVRGVDVRVLLYDSIEAAAYTHENEAREALYKMRDANTPGNIEVGLHNPATGRRDKFNIAFSHHQKMLVVDGRIGFVGGLDVAHGRWDDGNFDVVCDPALHILNDHYNNCLFKPRGMTPLEVALTHDWTDDSPEACGRKRPGFAPAYLPGLAIAVDRMKRQWDEGAALAELLDYADKAAITPLLEEKGKQVLSDAILSVLQEMVDVKGIPEMIKVVRTVGDVLNAIKIDLDQARHKYREVIAAGNRTLDEAGNGDLPGTLEAASDTVDAFISIHAKELDDWITEKMATLERYERRFLKVVDRLKAYSTDSSQILVDIEKAKAEALERYASARKKWEDFRTWLSTDINRDQALLDSGRQPRMPWQDVHARIEGPAVFDICRNFMHRWNAMVWQNQRGATIVGKAVVVGVNAGIDVAAEHGKPMPRQASLGRGLELTPLADHWLEAMGGRQAIFGDLCRAGSAGAISVQILRSSGTALHEMERKGCRKYGLDMVDGSQLKPYWERDQPMRSIQDAMFNCIASAKAFVYLETQFLISDCGFSDAEPGRALDRSVRNSRRGPSTEEEAKTARRATRGMGAVGGPLDAALPGTPVADMLAFKAGVPSAAKNKLIEVIATRIAKAIRSGQGFHVYMTLPVHPEGSIKDGAVVKQQYWLQQTLLRGQDSLIRRICRTLVAKRLDIRDVSVSEKDLRAELDAGGWKSYLTVLNLRSYGVLRDVNHDTYTSGPRTAGGSEANPPLYLVTEQCYVHSKLLIVDDAVAIIGSANCNDRSLQGDGDTELAAVMVDTETSVQDLGNGVRVVTRKFARDLRMRLWKKFLGMSITEEVVGRPAKRGGYTDATAAGGSLHPPMVKQYHPDVRLDLPADRSTVNYIGGRADRNASIYREVFTNTPCNSMPRYDATLSGFPSGGWSEEKKAWVRYIYGQPPDLQAAYMEVPSVLQEGATLVVGRHNMAKALARLRDGDDGDHVSGFWVTMPLEWGHGMDDPAASMPVELIAEAPQGRRDNRELAQALAKMDEEASTERA